MNPLYTQRTTLFWCAALAAAFSAQTGGQRGAHATPPSTATATATTTSATPRQGGALIVDPGLIQPSGTKAKKLTPLEKRAAQKAEEAKKPQPVFVPGPRLMPPQSPGTSETLLPPVGSPLAGPYVEQGPGPIFGAQAEIAAPGNLAIGACNALALHPTNADVMYAGFVNGGIWKTTNGTAASPTWTAQTDALGSLSIGALEIDPTDGTRNTLVAGIGLTSSLASVGGSRIGVLRTTDGGANWTLVNSTTMATRDISGIAARGATIVAAVNNAESFTYGDVGIYRSTNSGATFTRINGNSDVSIINGLPGGVATDLASDPSNTAILYTCMRQAGANGGIYKSTDTGASWARVSNATMNTQVQAAAGKVEITVGNAGNVYVAIVNGSGKLSGLHRSGDNGANWTALDLPGTLESGTFYGIHVGSQGNIHLSLAADPTNANIVYIGGDRQPRGHELVTPVFPNSIGAENYTGRLFRVNASLASGSQSAPLTHSGTASNTSPHADSRDMAFDANGNLIQGDDGGVYRRTSPSSAAGNWSSIVGAMKSTEIHDIAYDSISNRIIIGTQDNGALETSDANGSNTWDTVLSGDGGDVAVDDVTNAGSNQSIRYMSAQFLGNFVRMVMNSSGNYVSHTFPLLSASPAISPQFYTPIELNKVAPTRLLIGANNGLYESTNSGATATQIVSGFAAGDGVSGVGIAYGGKSGGIDNPYVFYALDGATVKVRTANGGPINTYTVATGGDVLLDVVMDPNEWNTAYAVGTTTVWKTVNAGANWTAITGDLTGVGKLRCIEYIPTGASGVIVVGGQTGVYRSTVAAPTAWNRVGTNMPAAAYVFDLDYDAADDVLVAGTLGRSVYKLNTASTYAPVALSAWEIF